MKQISVKDGDIITFDLIEWNEGWEFGRPLCMISPIKKEDNGDSSVDSFLFDILLNGCIDGYIKDDSMLKEAPWGGPKWKTLRKNHTKSLEGKIFPKYEYRGYRIRVEFYKNNENELDFRYLHWQEGNINFYQGN